MDFPCIRSVEDVRCPSQEECPISQAGFCPLFGKILKREIFVQRKKFSFLSDEEVVKDFLAEVYLNVKKSLPQLRIVNERGFTKFVRSIFHNRAIDYLKKCKREGQEESFSSLIDEEKESEYSIEEYITKKSISGSIAYFSEEEIYEKVEKILVKLRSLDHPCGELILYWYEKLQKGLKQKEMAEARGEKPNTFNQRLRRCFKYVSERILQ